MLTSTSSVLIVGASSGIALALAHAWAAAGRPLVLATRMPERLEHDAEDMRARYGVAVEVMEFDVLNTAATERLLDSLPELPGTVAVAVGVLGNQAQSAADVAEAERVMRANFLGPALFLGQVANRMERRGSGTIIGISSVAGDRGRASNYIYGAAKAGLTAFLSGLRNRLAARGVHVLTVIPGFVATRMTEGMRMPGLLTAQPDEVARAILRAEAKRRNTIYVRTVWRLIMTVICLLPESLFKKMKL